MKNKPDTLTDSAELRRRAEAKLKGEHRDMIPSAESAHRLLHELKVHQIELEMQNEELRQASAEAETSLQRYTELYDFAPTGYFTLESNGVISKANLAAAGILKMERAKLIGQRFGAFVAARSQSAFHAFIKTMPSEQAKASCEVELINAEGDVAFMLIEAAGQSGDAHHLAVADITRRKKADQTTAGLLRQNRALTSRMFTMQEEERRNMSRELHDELGQWLTAIQAEAQAINSMAGSALTIQASAHAISQSASAMHEVIHRMVHNLRPSLLDALGLVDSLRELEKQWCQPRLGIACDFVLASDLGDLSDDLKITLFRLVQEALNNIASHAQASQVAVQLRMGKGKTADVILLSIEDDGTGFDPAQPTKGTGLLGMRERTIAAGGEFDLVSKPGQGVHIIIKLPLKIPVDHDRRKA